MPVALPRIVRGHHNQHHSRLPDRYVALAGWGCLVWTFDWEWGGDKMDGSRPVDSDQRAYGRSTYPNQHAMVSDPRDNDHPIPTSGIWMVPGLWGGDLPIIWMVLPIPTNMHMDGSRTARQRPTDKHTFVSM